MLLAELFDTLLVFFLLLDFHSKSFPHGSCHSTLPLKICMLGTMFGTCLCHPRLICFPCAHFYINTLIVRFYFGNCYLCAQGLLFHSFIKQNQCHLDLNFCDALKILQIISIYGLGADIMYCTFFFFFLIYKKQDKGWNMVDLCVG